MDHGGDRARVLLWKIGIGLIKVENGLGARNFRKLILDR
jgi:hypothetical protein